MIAILTADIINSAQYETEAWMRVLKAALSQWGEAPHDWEIYRGDEFQLRTSPQQALKIAVELKARLKCIKDLDLRIAIGLGDEQYRGQGVSESNGTAHQRSGRMLEVLKKKKKNMGIDTGSPKHNRSLNLVIDLAMDFMDSWSTVSAEIAKISLAQPGITQTAIASELQIKQSAVSQRRKRARLSLVLDMLHYYTQILKEIQL
ncbi:MAG: hypothetical protein ACR2MM_05625 [Flavobacteriaceae bacterium]